MKFAKTLLVLALGLILFSPSMALAKSGKKKKNLPASTATLTNLKTDYNVLVNTKARYLSYAAKAEAEGYIKVSRLFAALAKSNGLLAKREAALIKAQGRTPASGKSESKIKDTKHNLLTAINAITYNVQATYPEYAKQAEADKNENAAKTFEQIMNVHYSQKRLLVTAAANLEEWKAEGDFYICQKCGHVAEVLDFETCPVCEAPKSAYEKVK